MRAVLIGLISGVVFGAGLALSGMLDPVRVRGFLDIAGAWDPTLAFVMGGAIIPMVIAWRIQARRAAPFAAAQFHLPDTRRVTPRLLAGAALFGVGWGLAGLCPGPAIATLALHPAPSAAFIAAMIAGFALVRAFERPLATRPAPAHR